MSPTPLTTDPVLVHAIFAYQQTKRLSLLLDQLKWSLDLDSHQPSEPTPWHMQLSLLIDEAKHHVSGLGSMIKHIAP
jgi:hypothetical protein